MSQKPKPKIARNLSAKTSGHYCFDNGDVAFGKNRRINGKEIKEEDLKEWTKK
jgi:hypothetical protein